MLTLAQSFGWNPRHLKAVARVESSGEGFYADGFPKVRFEPHHWNKRTGEYLDTMNIGALGIDEGEWNAMTKEQRIKRCRMPYTDSGRGFSRVKTETDRAAFERAHIVNETLAILCTSFGKFQIMGFNFKRCGCESAKQFFLRMKTDFLQDEMFANFINGDARYRKFLLMDATTLQSCKEFASAYNGPSNADEYGKKIYEAARA
jgi:hypothetical protein